MKKFSNAGVFPVLLCEKSEEMHIILPTLISIIIFFIRINLVLFSAK